jgi:hypothetical protein
MIIDGRTVEFSAGETILEVAEREGVSIPSLCRGMGKHQASCLLCLVRDRLSGAVLAACESRATDGMNIVTSEAEIDALRKRSMEFLLRDHGGDCRAPCALACPAGLDVDRVIALHERGLDAEAADALYRAIPLPRVANALCSAPCEAICALGKNGGTPVAVRALKDSLARSRGPSPRPAQTKGDVLVVGSGPTGLSALWTLSRSGYRVTLADSGEIGHTLFATGNPNLPEELAREEVSALLAATAPALLSIAITDATLPPPSRGRWDAVVLATGTPPFDDIPPEWFTAFAGKRKSVVAAFELGRRVALACIARLEGGAAPAMRIRHYPSRLGAISDAERSALVSRRDEAASSSTTATVATGCLHCGCDGFSECRMKDAALAMGISRPAGSRLRDAATLIPERCGDLLYESAKCIRCGLCVAAAATFCPPFPLALGMRGIKTRLFFDARNPADRATAKFLSDVCPTAALRVREGVEAGKENEL